MRQLFVYLLIRCVHRCTSHQISDPGPVALVPTITTPAFQRTAPIQVPYHVFGLMVKRAKSRSLICPAPRLNLTPAG